jgi:uncharacterized protein
MEKNKLLYFGLVLSAGLILSAVIAGAAFIKSRNNTDQITVTGSARERVTSDSVKWTSNFSRVIFRDNLKDGYMQMKKDENEVSKFLKDNGLKDDEISIAPVMTMEVWKSDANAPKEYTLTQNVEVRSSEVEKIKELSKNIQSLVNKGVFFSIVSVEYYYTKLPEMRVSLLPAAIKDAQNRAEIIAEASNKKIGAVKSVDTGSVQVLVPNSVDVSDYGAYDTSSIEKEIMVTVHPIFNLK